MDGEVTFTLAKANPMLEKRIALAQELGGDPLKYIRLHNKQNSIKQFTQKNVVATVFHNLVAEYIANVTPTYDILVNYGALGTGTSTPVIANTSLDTEVYRKEISSLSSSGNVVYVTVFYSSTEVDGTFFEHAFFSDATDTADSGVLVNRVLIDAPTGLAKSNTETLTIDYTLTIQ